ncbi:unnamed protein product [Cyclocybe aegerita]|uniref:Uncharacterized protein n=1 Tax=Cyclocybe aegerita TaxID=1973307 RepID=A0A8S0WL81_CYCAE|nr:unnamed protein product [Cyclocybe aegerita]
MEHNHNSKFELTKSVVMHVTQRTKSKKDKNGHRPPLDRPLLVIGDRVIEEVQSFKYLGIIINSQLQWKIQAQKAIEKATKFVLQYQRLTKITTGIRPSLMRTLYISTVLPKMTYGHDVWYTPPLKPAGSKKSKGSVSALRQMKRIQRIATTVISGGLRTTPNELVDAHSNLMPIDLALLKICHRATVRMLTLPKSHPLHRHIHVAQISNPKKPLL